MARWFVATLPIVGGEPDFGPVTSQMVGEGDTLDSAADMLIYKNGTIFQMVENPEKYASKNRATLVGKYLGRLDEGQFGTTGRPGVVVCTGSKKAFQWLKDNAVGDSAYDFETLEAAWQITAVRDWLKANGMPWVAGEFGPDEGSSYGRPTLPIVYCGQPHDPFIPEPEV